MYDPVVFALHATSNAMLCPRYASSVPVSGHLILKNSRRSVNRGWNGRLTLFSVKFATAASSGSLRVNSDVGAGCGNRGPPTKLLLATNASRRLASALSLCFIWRFTIYIIGQRGELDGRPIELLPKRQWDSFRNDGESRRNRVRTGDWLANASKGHKGLGAIVLKQNCYHLHMRFR